MMRRKIGAVLLAGAFALGSFAALDTAKAPAAQAAAGCLFDYNNTTVSMTVYNISCTSGNSVRPWISYYQSDNTTRVLTTYGVWKSSGSSAATKPSGSFYHSAGYNLS